MLFLTIVLLLAGLMLLFSGIENQSIANYMRTWIGTK